VSGLENVSTSSYFSASDTVYLDFYDSANMYQPGLYSAQSQLTIDWDESANMSLIYVIYSKTYTCDANGICVVTDIPCDKIVSAVVQNGVAKVSCQGSQAYIYAYDTITDRDYWYQSDSNLYHYHPVKPLPYASVKVYYLP